MKGDVLRLFVKASEVSAMLMLLLITLSIVACLILLSPVALLCGIMYGLFSLFANIESMLRQYILMNDKNNEDSRHSLSRSTVGKDPQPPEELRHLTLNGTINDKNLPN